MKKTKWTKGSRKSYRIVNEKNVLMGYYETKEEALKGAKETDSWFHKGYCYAIACVEYTIEYADGMFFCSEEKTYVIDKLVKEEDM